jgi:regulatory protein
LAFLSRREHSRKELMQKLRARGIDSEIVDNVLEQLAREGLQSDQRYIESYLSSRIHKGYGPVRLGMELRERGIEEDLIEACINDLDIDWMDTLHSVRRKKFGSTLPGDYKEQARESRFLQYRGFTTEQIRRLYKSDE